MNDKQFKQLEQAMVHVEKAQLLVKNCQHEEERGMSDDELQESTQVLGMETCLEALTDAWEALQELQEGE